MSKKSRFISILIVLVLAFSMLFIFNITASAANISIGSGSSLFTNTKNIEIEGTDDGIALRLTQKEYAYTEWSKTLPMSNFEMQFKINDDNFDKVTFSFYSAYNADAANDYTTAEFLAKPNPASGTYNVDYAEYTDKIKEIIQPEKVLNQIILEKVNDKIKLTFVTSSEGEEIYAVSDIAFLNSTFSIKYNVISAAKGQFTFTSGSYTKNSAEVDRLINDEANLRIDFPVDSIKSISKPIDNGGDEEETPAKKTLFIEYISYDYNIAGSPQRFTQELKGEVVEDTSRPILKADKNILKTTGGMADTVYAPAGAQYKIPVYGIDILHSLSNLSINATVKYYKDQTDYDNKVSSSVSVSNLAFLVDKTSGFYVIEKITLNDGTHLVNFGEKPTSAGASEIWYDNIDGITLPIKVQGAERMDPLDFSFNISQDYADLFKDIPLKGGPKNPVKFPMPISGTADFEGTDGTGIRSYVGGVGAGFEENPYNIIYNIYYKHQDDSTWTKNSDGLEFRATRTGKYKFQIEARDNQANIKYCETIIELTFIDTENPELSVLSFPSERIIDEQFNIPTASTTDDFDSSPTKTMNLYFLNEESKEWEQIKINGYNFTPKKLGEYKVVYTAYDNVGHHAVSIEREFTVVEPPESGGGGTFKLDTLSIVFLIIAGVALMGVIALLFIKPKEKIE